MAGSFLALHLKSRRGRSHCMAKKKKKGGKPKKPKGAGGSNTKTTPPVDPYSEHEEVRPKG